MYKDRFICVFGASTATDVRFTRSSLGDNRPPATAIRKCKKVRMPQKESFQGRQPAVVCRGLFRKDKVVCVVIGANIFTVLPSFQMSHGLLHARVVSVGSDTNSATREVV